MVASVKQFCPHFHLSLQSGSDSVLKRMNRKYTSQEYYDRVLLIKKQFELPSFTTDVITGFPGESVEEFYETLDFVKKIGNIIIKAFPATATNERKISNRTGKVYIDHLQNLRGKTIASVYSVRPFPNAPVSAPVYWEELPDCHPSMFTLKTMLKRVQKVGDLFLPLLNLNQELPKI